MERRWNSLKIMSCEALVQHIDIPEFHIHEKLSRQTYLVSGSESPIIYIARNSASSVMALNYLSEPLATYLEVPNLIGDIRVILTTSTEHIAELFTTLLMVPELPDSWKDGSENCIPSFTELVSQTIHSTSHGLSLRDDRIIDHPITEISNDEAASIMELINAVSSNDNMTPDRHASNEKQNRTRRSTSKKHRSRGVKVSLTHGFGENLSLNIDSAVTEHQEVYRQEVPFSWNVPRASFVPSPSIYHRPGFQEFDAVEEPGNKVAGFAGEYFVYSLILGETNVSDLQHIETTGCRFFIPKLD